jgi:hypothetical protein
MDVVAAKGCQKWRNKTQKAVHGHTPFHTQFAMTSSPFAPATNRKRWKLGIPAATPLAIAEPPSQPAAEDAARLAKLGIGASGQAHRARRECAALLLSLSNKWFPCTVMHNPNGMLSIHGAIDGIAGGMSGSPIIAEDAPPSASSALPVVSPVTTFPLRAARTRASRATCRAGC